MAKKGQVEKVKYLSIDKIGKWYLKAVPVKAI